MSLTETAAACIRNLKDWEEYSRFRKSRRFAEDALLAFQKESNQTSLAEYVQDTLLYFDPIRFQPGTVIRALHNRGTDMPSEYVWMIYGLKSKEGRDIFTIHEKRPFLLTLGASPFYCNGEFFPKNYAGSRTWVLYGFPIDRHSITYGGDSIQLTFKNNGKPPVLLDISRIDVMGGYVKGDPEEKEEIHITKLVPQPCLVI